MEPKTGRGHKSRARWGRAGLCSRCFFWPCSEILTPKRAEAIDEEMKEETLVKNIFHHVPRKQPIKNWSLHGGIHQHYPLTTTPSTIDWGVAWHKAGQLHPPLESGASGKLGFAVQEHRKKSIKHIHQVRGFKHNPNTPWVPYMPPQTDPPGTTPGRFSAVLWQSHGASGIRKIRNHLIRKTRYKVRCGSDSTRRHVIDTPRFHELRTPLVNSHLPTLRKKNKGPWLQRTSPCHVPGRLRWISLG